jgi:hypothetical protein
MDSERRRKLEEANPFDLLDRMANAGHEKDIERVEVTRPVATDEHGVTWVGSIGMSQTGLIIPDDISQNEWFDFYEVIRNVKKSLQYIIGDWFAFGNKNFEYSYEQIAALTGYKPSTVEMFASVCRNVPQLTRINSPHFTYSRAVALLPEHQQIQALEYAKEHGMSARQLFAYIRGVNPRQLGGRKRQKTRTNIVDRVAFNQLKNASEAKRLKVAQQLREMADQLERGQ